MGEEGNTLCMLGCYLRALSHRGKGKVEVCGGSGGDELHSTTVPHVSRNNFHQKNDFHLPLATRQQTNHI